MAIAELLAGVLGGDLPIEVRAYDGSRTGPLDAPAAIVLRSPNALRRMITAPGELGLGREAELQVPGPEPEVEQGPQGVSHGRMIRT